MFIVTKLIIEGPLKGCSLDDRSPVPFVVGRTYGGHGFGSRYRVTACCKASL